ncbi:hypothetical protein ACFPYI_00545 [Halomarina salina]|uniref:Uncharacterized protein n=1 Tax=Halomarina salina TaxID=1872699 RepID=A0ABD5RHK3_9EURY|nr:hypothetical protein [Halomarina salina]
MTPHDSPVEGAARGSLAGEFTEPYLCRACSTDAAGERPATVDELLAQDDAPGCPNDVVGRYRIDRQSGLPVNGWLCADHRDALRKHLVTTFAEY